MVPVIWPGRWPGAAACRHSVRGDKRESAGCRCQPARAVLHSAVDAMPPLVPDGGPAGCPSDVRRHSAADSAGSSDPETPVPPPVRAAAAVRRVSAGAGPRLSVADSLRSGFRGAATAVPRAPPCFFRSPRTQPGQGFLPLRAGGPGHRGSSCCCRDIAGAAVRAREQSGPWAGRGGELCIPWFDP
ncbi:MAG: Uncharacterised protein [Synechococcus sp. CC9902]|nr:MAG: Uncharacterised protein [Synechococcus sp. CC9902]